MTYIPPTKDGKPAIIANKEKGVIGEEINPIKESEQRINFHIFNIESKVKLLEKHVNNVDKSSSKLFSGIEKLFKKEADNLKEKITDITFNILNKSKKEVKEELNNLLEELEDTNISKQIKALKTIKHLKLAAYIQMVFNILMITYLLLT